MSPIAALWTNWFATGLWPIAGGEGGKLMTPVLMVFLSCLFAMLYYGPAFTKQKLWGKLFDRKLWPYLLVVGLFGTALPFTTMFIALQYTTPANAAILNQVEILYSLILAFIFLREKPTLGQLGGSLLVVAGVVIILFNEQFSPRWKGDIIVLLTPWMFQVSHIAAKKLPADISPVFIAGARVIYAGITIIPLLIFFALKGGLQFTAAPKTFLVLFFIGTIYYGVTQPLWYRAIRGMDLAKATAIILSYPILTLIVSAALGVEKIHLYQTVGLALAFGGALWITMIVRREKDNEKISNV
ncbi:drug/metabolite transporter (DMT)-like permease [Elusimicrobium simillimum]|uniref:DMT family transporter n=1 Tax=Elusimicrobium simillimum TaxID=3143438 RepID=UPI003C6F23E7